MALNFEKGVLLMANNVRQEHKTNNEDPAKQAREKKADKDKADEETEFRIGFAPLARSDHYSRPLWSAALGRRSSWFDGYRRGEAEIDRAQEKLK